MDFKFALRDFSGKPVSYYIAREVTPPKPVVEKTIAHHIVVVDRSGSMYGVMNDTKMMVEKVMTIEEYKDSELLLSLISYSSEGDVTTHFSRRKVSDILTPGSAEIESLRQIRATSLTCASQALEAAAGLVESETTAITLHTDGWFNDRSPGAEKKKIDKILKDLEKKPNVFVNCVSHGNYTDFTYLSSIANRMSGSCVVAKNIKELYDALHDTTALLAGRVTPAIPVGIGDADWQIALNLSQKKVNGSSVDLTIRGTKPEDQLKIYRFSRVSEVTYNKSAELEGACADVIAAFARTKLAEGKINEAKFALVALRDVALLRKHYNALSSDRLRAFALDLDDLMNGHSSLRVDAGYGLPQIGKPLTDLFELLNENRSKFAVHLPFFSQTYTRRGIRKLNGTFDESGTYKPNEVELVEVDSFEADPFVEVSSFDVNTSEATINMTTSRSAELQKNGTRVPRVAGKKLDLSIIKSYTVIADGEVNAAVLPLLVNDKTLFASLQEGGWVPSDAPFGEVVFITLSQFPVVPLRETAADAPDFDELLSYAQALVAEKILKAVLPAEAKGAQEWTPEQIAELKSYGLTPTLFFSAPSSVPYTDRDKAIAEGWIDSYTKYTVSFGTEHATDLRTSLWSANEMLQRFYEIEGIKKPKFSDLASSEGKLSQKVIKKPVMLDKLVFPVISSYIDQGVHAWPVERIKRALDGLKDTIRETEAHLSALALMIGSTGLIPETWDAKILTAEQLAARHDTIDIPKAHADGTFFDTNGIYLGVHAEVSWYSTPKGLEEAERIGA